MDVKVRNLAIPLIFAVALIAVACGGDDSIADVSDAPTELAVPTSTSVVASTPTVPAPIATTAPTPTKQPSPTSTTVPTSTAVPKPTAAATATSIPTPKPTSTPIPTQVPTPVPTVPPTATIIPTVTPTVWPPTSTPIGYSVFTGNGNVETAVFDSPPNLPWGIEWVAQGEGANTFKAMLVDPEDGTELVYGNMVTFYLRVEGPESGWSIWVSQQ